MLPVLKVPGERSHSPPKLGLTYHIVGNPDGQRQPRPRKEDTFPHNQLGLMIEFPISSLTCLAATSASSAYLEYTIFLRAPKHILVLAL